MPKYSVVIPTVNRPGLMRAARSVYHQTFKDWELIIVDDFSKEEVSEYYLPTDFRVDHASLRKVKIFRFKEKQGKLIARNFGMNSAQGDWICWLDDDDEYSCRYLEYVDKFVTENPGVNLVNLGIIRFWRGGQTDMLPIHDFLKVNFKSGMIATGTFVFKRSCVSTVGLFPEVKSWQEFSQKSGIPHYNGEEDGKVRPMGNPWGDDFWYFKKLLEHYEPKPLRAYLYFQHVGGGHNV